MALSGVLASDFTVTRDKDRISGGSTTRRDDRVECPGFASLPSTPSGSSLRALGGSCEITLVSRHSLP